jgi:hypothetical protein
LSMKKVRSAAAAVRYVAPLMTIFAIFALWIYGRTANFELTLALGVLLTLLTGILLIMGREKFFADSAKKRERAEDARKGRVHLLLQAEGDALKLLLEAMRSDYPVEDISYSEKSGNFATGRRGGLNIGLSFINSLESGEYEAGLVALYRKCLQQKLDRGVLLLMGEEPKGLSLLCAQLPEPRVIIIPGSRLEDYFAQVGEKSPCEAAAGSRNLKGIFTKKNGVRCMIAAAYMISAHIALKMAWFLPAGLALALFASVCRYMDIETAKLF